MQQGIQELINWKVNKVINEKSQLQEQEIIDIQLFDRMIQFVRHQQILVKIDNLDIYQKQIYHNYCKQYEQQIYEQKYNEIIHFLVLLKEQIFNIQYLSIKTNKTQANKLKQLIKYEFHFRKLMISLIKFTSINEELRISASNCIFLLALLGEDLSNQNFQGVHLINTNISGLRFKNTDLSYSNFINVNISGINIHSANLSNAKWMSIYCNEQEAIEMKRNETNINIIKISPNLQYIITIATSSQPLYTCINVWSVKLNKLIASYKSFYVCYKFQKIEFSQNSQVVYFLGDRIIQFQTRTLKLLSIQCYGQQEIINLKLFKDQSQYLTLNDKLQYDIWNVRYHRCIYQYKNKQKEKINQSFISSDLKMIAYLVQNIKIILFDLQNNKKIAIIKQDKLVNNFWISQNKQFIAILKDRILELWEIKNRQFYSMLIDYNSRSFQHKQYIYNYDITAVTFTKDASLIITCGQEKCIRIWSTISGCLHALFEAHKYSIGYIDISNDNQILASVTCKDNNIKLWNIDKEQLIKTNKKKIQTYMTPDKYIQKYNANGLLNPEPACFYRSISSSYQNLVNDSKIQNIPNITAYECILNNTIIKNKQNQNLIHLFERKAQQIK